MSTGKLYKVIGRNVHMDYVKDYLMVKKNVNFSDTQNIPNNIDIEILADTIYVKVLHIVDCL